MAQVEYLTVREALAKVLAEFERLPTEAVPLRQARGRILGKEVVARDSLPPFANSSMDGYALQGNDSRGASSERPQTLRVVGEVAAGALFEGTVEGGEAVRIMTGAPLPPGADAVIPVEETNESWRGSDRPLPTEIEIYRAVDPGDYIRRAGEDIIAGETVLEAGHFLRPQEIGVLASLGISQVEVIRRPRVGVLATGDELIAVEEPLQPGKIRNSNGYTQAAQVEALGGVAIDLGVARDTEDDVRRCLQKGIDEQIDLFISSAGVSVGVYDVVTAVLQGAGEVNFWRVRMRPGKPLAFGRYGGIPYFGLPGNPVSSTVSFERFARPAILKMAGHSELERPRIKVTMTEAMSSDGRESYMRAIVTRTAEGGYEARTTGGQGSHMMTSLIKANALVIIPEGVKETAVEAELEGFFID